MVSPQKENGYTAIANELLEALAYCVISPNERSFLDVLIRMTYGWNKKGDFLSVSQVSAATGMSLSTVCHVKKKLLDGVMIVQTGNNISFNKDYTQWKVRIRVLKVARLNKLPEQASELPEQAINCCSNEQSHLIKTIKTITTKAKRRPKELIVDGEEDEYRAFLPIVSKVLGHDKIFTEKGLQKWRARRRRFAAREIGEAFLNLQREPDRWKISNNGWRPMHWWLHTDERIEEMKLVHLKAAGPSRNQAIVI